MRAAPGEARAFLDAAIVSSTDECIVWPFALRNGYAVLGVGKKVEYGHRLACEARNGPPPEGTSALHLPGVCHRSECVNPRHLRWGTQRENIADRHLDGTHYIGERNPSAKISEEDVVEIRRLRQQGLTYKAIGEQFGITFQMVHKIVRLKSWTHVGQVQA